MVKTIENIPEIIKKNNKKTPKKHIKRITSRALRAARKQLINEYMSTFAVNSSCEETNFAL